MLNTRTTAPRSTTMAYWPDAVPEGIVTLNCIPPSAPVTSERLETVQVVCWPPLSAKILAPSGVLAAAVPLEWETKIWTVNVSPAENGGALAPTKDALPEAAWETKNGNDLEML